QIRCCRRAGAIDAVEPGATFRVRLTGAAGVPAAIQRSVAREAVVGAGDRPAILAALIGRRAGGAELQAALLRRRAADPAPRRADDGAGERAQRASARLARREEPRPAVEAASIHRVPLPESTAPPERGA